MDEERRLRVKQRQTRIAETLIRAAEDPPFRETLLADPQSLFGGTAAPSEKVPDHILDMRRQIIAHLVDRATTDANFPAQLRTDLFGAIRHAGLMPEMEQLRAELPVNAEVSGFGWPGGWGGDPWDDWGEGWGH